jgi:hypothetical protein
MMKTPKEHEKVEVLVGDKWLPAVFVGADSVEMGSGEDEMWWMDYFMLENGRTIPDDITDGTLPQWRPAVR